MDSDVQYPDMLQSPIIDDWHLSLPFLPRLIICDQLRHKVRHIDAAGLAGIKDRAAQW